MKKLLILLITGYVLLLTAKYWYADYSYANGAIEKAIALSPQEPLYRIELAKTYALVRNSTLAEQEIAFVKTRHPRNIKLLKEIAYIYDDLGDFEKELQLLEELTKLAPTDAQIWYQLSLSYGKNGDLEKAEETVQKVIKIKPDYKLARKYLANIYLSKGNDQKAREQYEYILKNISPDDQEVIDYLKQPNR